MTIFIEDALYISETTHKEFYGIDGIIEKFSEVHKKKVKCYAYLATVTESRTYDIEEGTRCIALAYDKEDNFEALCFLTLDENDMIERIKITPRSNFGFRLVP